MRKLNTEKIRKLIERSGDSIQQFALCNGIPPDSLRKWLRGDRNAKKGNIETLAAALHCSIEEISEIVMEIDPGEIDAFERDMDELRGLWGYLSKSQQENHLKMIRETADLNKRIEQLEHYPDGK